MLDLRPNEKSLDGFSPETGWIKIDLTRLFHIHRVYEMKRRRIQRKASKKPSLRRVLAKYSSIPKAPSKAYEGMERVHPNRGKG
jgi:hypothetical protein